MIALIVQLAILTIPAAASDFFPIGIFNVANPEILPALEAAGFNSFFADPSSRDGYDPLARAARRYGMRMIVPPDVLLENRHETKEWPVLAWYLDDEPEIHNRPADELRRLSNLVAERDGRPQTFAVGTGAAAGPYGDVGDILMLDWYPIPHLSLNSVAQQLDLAYARLPADKKIWMIIQAFDWREEPQRDPTKPRIGRFPSAQEIRFMSYLAIIHGADGIFYFRLARPGPSTLIDHPNLWRRVSGTTLELSKLSPVLSKGRPAQLPFLSPPAGLDARAWSHGGRDYVIIANCKSNPLPLPTAILANGWELLFDKLDDSHSIAPFSIAVFRGPLHPMGSR